MYGWIADGISSLFEPVSGPEPPAVSQLAGAGLEAAAPGRESSSRAAKRSYHSVYFADGFCQSDQVEVKRRRRDVVISFAKKIVAGVAGLLGLQKPEKLENPNQNEESQPVTLMGIDELHTSWPNSAECRMDKAVGGLNERGGANLFQGSLPPLVRKYSGPALPAGLPDRGKDRERRGSLQLLPSRPALRAATSNPDTMCNGIGHNRFFKPSLTVEETIKQTNKEHYRRLLEMVTEKYSKSQPLPFNQTKPQDELLSQVDHKRAASGKTFESVSRKMGCTAAPHLLTYRNASATKDRWSSLTFSKSYIGDLDTTQPVRCTKRRAVELDLSAEVASRLSLVDRDTPAVPRYDTLSGYTTHTRHSDEDIPRFTKEMAEDVSRALAQSDPNLVLSSAFKLRITHRDLVTLQEGSWLNDEVINFYLSLIMERSSGEAGQLKVYTFSTFFLPKLQGGGHAAVKRWTKAVDLFLFDIILVPLHLGVHWAMAVIDLKSKTVKSYDSVGHRHDDICSLLLLYLKEEHKVKKGRELDGSRWTVGSLKSNDVPQQKNWSDCGVFACKYADYIAKGKSLTFKQCHMPVFRKLMMWEILHQKLL
ncbi:sentrin-specific protease 2 [Cololabis saira]|uniref:sentrin-specific protease 2 n=1 Tax=Cololabis saira TaxID=129043 RepID=UPI002AD46015|nr:sentrin-specific protease 2 [Cololabis saira]